MHLHHLNLLAVLVAAISTMLVGFLFSQRPGCAKWAMIRRTKPRSRPCRRALAPPALRYQHGIPTRQLPGYGFHPHRLEMIQISGGWGPLFPVSGLLEQLDEGFTRVSSMAQSRTGTWLNVKFIFRGSMRSIGERVWHKTQFF